MVEDLLQQLVKMVAKNNELTQTLTEKVEGLQSNVNGLEGKLHNMEKDMHTRFDKVERQLKLLESDFDLLYAKTAEHERELHRLKAN